MKGIVIANPAAGTGEQFEELCQAVRDMQGLHLAQTEAEGDARQLARKAVQDETDLIVAVGGDGTVHEVVNGMAINFGASRLAVVPMGTANDFARTLNNPNDLKSALAL